jgi:hypothetical protein
MLIYPKKSWKIIKQFKGIKINQRWVGGRQSTEGWIGGHKAAIKYIRVAHKERARQKSSTTING